MILKLQRTILLTALCGILAAPICMRAQMGGMSMSSAATASPADVYNKLLTGQEDEIVGIADAMPAEKYSYAPTMGEFKGVRTFGDQIKHIAGANYGFFASWNVPGMKSPADIDKLSSKADIMAALKESFTFAHVAMSTITAQNAFTPMGKDNGTRAGTATRALAHMMDHYGQLVEYVRMNGMVPPASRRRSM